MEATRDYWRAPFYLLEDRLETWLVNPHDVKHLPSRPRTDRWMPPHCARSPSVRCCGRASFPAGDAGAARRTRYRVDLLAVCTAEKHRGEKRLEDELIKHSVAVSDPFGAPGRRSWPS